MNYFQALTKPNFGSDVISLQAVATKVYHEVWLYRTTQIASSECPFFCGCHTIWSFEVGSWRVDPERSETMAGK
jgi:hypothetical protein